MGVIGISTRARLVYNVNGTWQADCSKLYLVASVIEYGHCYATLLGTLAIGYAMLTHDT